MKFIVFLIICLLMGPRFAGAGEKLLVREAARTVILTGYTRNAVSQIVSSEVSGKVLAVHYEIGDTIGDGPFIEIDPTFINFQITSAVQSSDRLSVAVSRAESRAVYLEKEASRIRELHKEDMATESRADRIIQDLDQAKLERDITLREKEILETQLSELNERKKRFTIYAPRGWVVTDRTVEVNENVQPGTPLARVSDFRKLVVPLHVSPEELSAIQSLPQLFNAELEGFIVNTSINWVNPEFNEVSRKLSIELSVHKYGGAKRGGLRFSLPLTIKTEGLHIPRDAVSTRYDNPVVQVKRTGEIIPLVVLGQADGFFLAASDKRLHPGIELTPASSMYLDEDK